MSEPTTFVLVPGAGGNASYWAELVPELETRGHAAIAVDIREDDPALGLPEYADAVEAAIGARRDVVLVAQSLGGFTAPMVARRARCGMIVLLNAMIPRPGETPGAWWDAVGWAEAGRPPPAPVATRPSSTWTRTSCTTSRPTCCARQAQLDPPREPSDTPFGQPCDVRALARRPDQGARRPRRPVLPGRVPAPRGAGAARPRAWTRSPAATWSR